MGLDMFLKRKKYVGAQFDHRKVSGEIKIKIGDKDLPIDFKKISYIEEEVCYWRKANAIHKFFVDKNDGVDNCSDIYVSIADLEELLGKCKEVKEKAILEDGKCIKNTEEIAKILPTQDGFFFGSTEYDEYYLQDIDYTIEKMQEIIDEENKLNADGIYCDYYYEASW